MLYTQRLLKFIHKTNPKYVSIWVTFYSCLRFISFIHTLVIKKIKVLGQAGKVTWKNQSDSIHIHLPTLESKSIGYALEITLWWYRLSAVIAFQRVIVHLLCLMLLYIVVVSRVLWVILLLRCTFNTCCSSVLVLDFILEEKHLPL
jgi:hypothetical protein